MPHHLFSAGEKSSNPELVVRLYKPGNDTAKPDDLVDNNGVPLLRQRDMKMHIHKLEGKPVLYDHQPSFGPVGRVTRAWIDADGSAMVAVVIDRSLGKFANEVADRVRRGELKEFSIHWEGNRDANTGEVSNVEFPEVTITEKAYYAGSEVVRVMASENGQGSAKTYINAFIPGAQIGEIMSASQPQVPTTATPTAAAAPTTTTQQQTQPSQVQPAAPSAPVPSTMIDLSSSQPRQESLTIAAPPQANPPQPLEEAAKTIESLKAKIAELEPKANAHDTIVKIRTEKWAKEQKPVLERATKLAQQYFKDSDLQKPVLESLQAIATNPAIKGAAVWDFISHLISDYESMFNALKSTHVGMQRLSASTRPVSVTASANTAASASAPNIMDLYQSDPDAYRRLMNTIFTDSQSTSTAATTSALEQQQQQQQHEMPSSSSIPVSVEASASKRRRVADPVDLANVMFEALAAPGGPPAGSDIQKHNITLYQRLLQEDPRLKPGMTL